MQNDSLNELNNKLGGNKSSPPQLIDAATAGRKALLTLQDFMYFYSCGRTKAYAEIKAGRLRALKNGRRTLIAQVDADAWRAALPEMNRN